MINIQIDSLSKYYGRQLALDIHSLQINPGELVGIVGNNGAGKTTFFRLLLDLLAPDGGSISFNGIALNESEQWKGFTGSFLDEGFLIDFLRPEEFFEFNASLYGMGSMEVAERIRDFSSFFDGEILEKNKYIRQFSTGNRQKIGIASAMLPRPGLLILDEPFNFLDPSSQIIIKRLLEDENRVNGSTVLISSHNINHIADICSRILLLEKGRIIQDIRPDEKNLDILHDYFGARAGS